MYQILAEEESFIVVNKSAGVHFHSQSGNLGVAAQLAHDTGKKWYPVHRLDTVTSGLLLFARTPEAARVFSTLFAEHGVQKYYLALAEGKPKKKQGRIAGDMAKARRSRYKLLRSMEHPAVTQFFSRSLVPGIRMYLLKPLTGKTHQLRVAMASLGTPILGDTLYGAKESDRTYLHAWHLEFVLAGRLYHFTAMPDQGELYVGQEVNELVAQWTSPSSLPWPEKHL
ncbi:TIGR01621 family pseudouridine synthase [Desulfogranum japonicum]|uniref:TIGR01621 family pseudouridine synthase n=1 Tax=Desulfogranum japonicum TaxID=231447 RepID=UPI000424A992|nr:TIGR01621 family pseudouridine synthase [Desulfogranum japonicum]